MVENHLTLHTKSHKYNVFMGLIQGRNDVVVSRDVVFIEEKPVNQTPAIYEEPRTVHESITVLPGPPENTEQQQLPTPPATEHPESESDSDLEESGPEMVDPQILLQELTGGSAGGSAGESATGGPRKSATGGPTDGSTRTSARSNKGILTSTKFQ